MKKVVKEVGQKPKKTSTNLLLGMLAASVILLAMVVWAVGATSLDNRSDAKGKANRGDPPAKQKDTRSRQVEVKPATKQTKYDSVDRSSPVKTTKNSIVLPDMTRK